jgi:hypothetical protein
MAEIPNRSSGKGADGYQRGRTAAATTVTESEDQVRNLKASQSVEAAFQAAGIPSPPGDIAAIITNHVKSEIQTLPLSQVANMSPGSGPLGTSAIAAVNQFVSSLTPSQREAVKAGVNPLDASAMMKLGGLFKSDANNFGRLAGRDGVEGSSARFDGIGTQGFTQTQLQARDLATKLGLGWATNNPDLLRLGPSAIQALADVHLQKESYDRFKNGGLSDKAIVGGARWAKRTGTDYNEASKTYEAVQQALPAADQQAHSRAVEQYFKTVGTEKPPTSAEEQAAKDTFNKAVEPIKQRNPQAVPQIEREQKELKTVKQQERAATANADSKEGQAKAAKSGNDDLMASLNAPAPATASPTTTTEGAAKPVENKHGKPKPTVRVAGAGPKVGGS